MATKLDARQIILRSLLSNVKSIANEELDNILTLVDDKLNDILKISASGAVVTISSSIKQVLKSDGSDGTTNSNRVSISPLSGVIISTDSSTLNVSSGAVTGDFEAAPISPSMTSSYYVNVGFEIRQDGKIYVLFGAEFANAGDKDLAVNAPVFTKKSIPIGYITIQDDSSGGQWNFSNPVETNIIKFQSGGGGGAGDDSGAGIDPADGFKELIFDNIDLSPSDANSLFSATNGSHNLAKTLLKLLCDKSLTATTTGTSYTLSGSPSFTVAANDIIYANGEWRKIASISSQTQGTLDVAFTSDLSADTCMVSQAAFTKDFINLGDATEKTRIRDFYSVNINTIHVDYTDSLIVDDGIPDYVDEARIVCSASNEGLRTDTVTYPTSDEFSTIFTRPQAPNDILDYDLSVNTNQERLFLAFFPNPSNASVTAQANLINYECSLVEDALIAQGGIIDSAYTKTDSSITSVNGDQPTVVGGKTRFKVNFTFNLIVNGRIAILQA